MTEVAFHFNAPDRVGYACRLLRKAYRKGAHLQVLADAPLASELDLKLWTMAGTEFIPHCREGALPALQRHSPIIIANTAQPPDAVGTVLVNLTDVMPEGYERFARVIEVVTAEAPVRAKARERWKRYKAAGLEPQHLDLQNTVNSA